MTHGQIRGYDHFTDQSRFTVFLDRVKDVESDIWVGTFKDVVAYVTERDEVRLHIDRRSHSGFRRKIITPVAAVRLLSSSGTLRHKAD